MSYSRPQLKLLFLLAAVFLVGLGVREWRAGFPDAAERLERFDREDPPPPIPPAPARRRAGRPRARRPRRRCERFRRRGRALPRLPRRSQIRARSTSTAPARTKSPGCP